MQTIPNRNTPAPKKLATVLANWHHFLAFYVEHANMKAPRVELHRAFYAGAASTVLTLAEAAGGEKPTGALGAIADEINDYAAGARDVPSL
jgi:hypothetical protein